MQRQERAAALPAQSKGTASERRVAVESGGPGCRIKCRPAAPAVRAAQIAERGSAAVSVAGDCIDKDLAVGGAGLES